MGRKKLKIEYEENNSKRQSLVSKRIPGLLKKVIELNQLTGSHIHMEILDSNGKYWDLNTDDDDEQRQQHFIIESEKAIQQNKYEKVDVIDGYDTLKNKTVLTKEEMCIRNDFKVIRPRVRSSTDPYPRRNNINNASNYDQGLNNLQVYKRRFTQNQQSRTVQFSHNDVNDQVTNVVVDQRQSTYSFEEDLAERLNMDIEQYFPQNTDPNECETSYLTDLLVSLKLPPPPPHSSYQSIDTVENPTSIVPLDQQHSQEIGFYTDQPNSTIDYNQVFEIEGKSVEFGSIYVKQHLIIARQIFHPVLFAQE